jgi:hypothetical protein
MPKINKNKLQINATVSPWIKKRCIELANEPEFTSISDIVTIALIEFFEKYDTFYSQKDACIKKQSFCELMKKKTIYGEEIIDFLIN